MIKRIFFVLIILSILNAAVFKGKIVAEEQGAALASYSFKINDQTLTTGDKGDYQSAIDVQNPNKYQLNYGGQELVLLTDKTLINMQLTKEKLNQIKLHENSSDINLTVLENGQPVIGGYISLYIVINGEQLLPLREKLYNYNAGKVSWGNVRVSEGLFIVIERDGKRYFKQLTSVVPGRIYDETLELNDFERLAATSIACQDRFGCDTPLVLTEAFANNYFDKDIKPYYIKNISGLNYYQAGRQELALPQNHRIEFSNSGGVVHYNASDKYFNLIVIKAVTAANKKVTIYSDLENFNIALATLGSGLTLQSAIAYRIADFEMSKFSPDYINDSSEYVELVTTEIKHDVEDVNE